MKLSYQQQLKNMDDNAREVKKMQQKIYGTKKRKPKKQKDDREITGYYWDGKEEHILYDREPL